MTAKRRGLSDEMKAQAPKKQAEAIERDVAIASLKERVGVAEAKYSTLLRQHEALKASQETRADLRTVKAARLPKPNRKQHASRATAVIVLSDWHCEETVYPENVNGLNEFNLEVAERRIANTFNKALMLLQDARHLADIREVVVALLGDFITGYIHDELMESNSLAPLPAKRFAKKHIMGGLNQLIAHGDLESIKCVTCRGNHGRTTPKMRISTAADNSFEQDMYHSLQESFESEPRITWNIGEGEYTWQTIQERDFRFSHGNSIKFLGGIGGLTIPALRKIANWDRTRTAYCDVFGDKHTFIPYGKFIANGSLIGHGSFGDFIGAPFDRPKQAFMVVDKIYGITRCIPIFCE